MYKSKPESSLSLRLWAAVLLCGLLQLSQWIEAEHIGDADCQEASCALCQVAEDDGFAICGLGNNAILPRFLVSPASTADWNVDPIRATPPIRAPPIVA